MSNDIGLVVRKLFLFWNNSCSETTCSCLGLLAAAQPSTTTTIVFDHHLRRFLFLP